MGETQIIAEPGSHQILITREFAAPRDLLFRAHTDPELLCSGSARNLTMVIDRLDARDGGTWRFTHRDSDGVEYGFHGVFHGTRMASCRPSSSKALQAMSPLRR